MSNTILVKVEFSGGLELLFGNKRSHKLSLPPVVPSNNDTRSDAAVPDGERKPADVAYLIAYLRDHLLQERAELFEEGRTVRPGILVLVNDTDWELEGEGEYALRDGDEVVFISTFRGG